MTGADIPLNCQIGGGLLIPHPNGIVIHPDAKIGVNCLVFQQVTIGGRDSLGCPVIDGHVDIGAGAKILGKLRIGPHARIGANAVVIHDVMGGALAVGFPVTLTAEVFLMLERASGKIVVSATFYDRTCFAQLVVHAGASRTFP